MGQWSERFLGISHIPGDLSAFELGEFFHLSNADVVAIKKAFRTRFRVAAGIQLGFIRMSGGTLTSFRTIPRELVKFIADQLGEAPPAVTSFRALYNTRERTRIEHQVWAVEYLNLKSHTDRQERMLLAAMRDASRGIGNVDRLVTMAGQWLHDRNLLIPSHSTLRDICVRASNDTEQEIYVAICKEVPEERRQSWIDAVFSHRKNGKTHLQWLQQAPRRRSQKNLKVMFEKVEYLKELGVAELKLESIPIERLRDFALSMQHRSPSQFKRLAPVTQALLLVSFLKVTLYQATDTIIQLSGKMTSDVVSSATQKVKKSEAKTLLTYRQALSSIFEFNNDDSMSAEELRKKIREIQNMFGATLFPSLASAVRAQLTESNPKVRPLLRSLSTLKVEGVGNERAVEGLRILRGLYDKETTELPAGKFNCSKQWQALVDDDDRKRAMRAFEVATLVELRKAFRRGSAWVDHSDTYRDRDNLLISSEKWEKQKARHYNQLRLSRDPDEFLGPMIEEARLGLKAVAEAEAAGEIHIRERDIGLDALEAEPVPPEIAAVNSLFEEEIGKIQLPELMLDVDSKTHFSTELAGRRPRTDLDVLKPYGGLLGLGTDITAIGVALMIPELSVGDISSWMKELEHDAAIERANKVVLEFIRSLPITKLWGDGKSASADMMALAASHHLWCQRKDPRTKVPAIGMYSHVHDQSPIIHNMPIVLGERQAGAAIEGVLRQTEIELERLGVDTHGYTDFAMAVARALGFDLCPRLRNLRERRLIVPKDMDVPENIKIVVDRTLNLDVVRDQWDEFVRVVASISNGTVSAVTALQRFGSVAQGDPIYNAGRTLGRLCRTNYLSIFFTDPLFRREIYRVLNRGESVHTLQHAIHLNSIRHDRGRRPEELIAISSALTLLTNIVIAWYAYRMQGAVKALRAKGISISDDVLRHTLPNRWEGVNFRGTFKFPIERYRAALLIDSPALKVG
ncbi:Tn3 family transposase [Sinimarinibacterium flocculans]|uniref:TnpA family transposase n=1 Tax=Sinimarinibacterium flocculans TaxID=985250 RepID=A0A318EI68_9GAMM|nr:Tn3 family transposase [Sinimarinibacterium flocculans]PXV71630.1 TnpA family transposase [Sinimarinibacterium flocculans]